VLVELLPLTSEIRLCNAELNGPPPKPPGGGGGIPRNPPVVESVPLAAAAVVPGVALVAEVAVVVVAVAVAAVPLLLPVAEPVACASSAWTRFWMKASIASCGVVVLELDADEEVLDVESVAAASEAVELPPVAAVAAELAVVTAPESVSACISAASRPPAGGPPGVVLLVPVAPVVPLAEV